MIGHRHAGPSRLKQSASRRTQRAPRFALARRHRGSLLVEVAMATVMLMIGMTLTVKVLGWVALERRAAERRQCAVMEVADVMERITAYPFDEINSALARRITLSEPARGYLRDAELALDVSDAATGAGLAAKRIAVRLRWRGRSGDWSAPVRLTSWLERARRGS